MSESRLRDLLEDRVAELEPLDLSGDAWRHAVELRRRRRTLAGVVLAVTAVLGGVGVVVSGEGGRPEPSPATSGGVPTPTTPTTGDPSPTRPAPRAVRAGRQHDAAVWWAPDKQEEANLPHLDVRGVPREIDLSAGSPSHQPGVAALAVFMAGDSDGAGPGRVVVLGEDGATYSLDVGRLVPVADVAGNGYSALGEESLAPDGRQVFFRQLGSLEVYDLVSGAWTTIDTPAWLAEGARWLASGELWVPEVLGDEDGPGTVYDASGQIQRTDWRAHYTLWEAGAGQAFGPQALDPIGVHLSGLGPATAQAQFPGVELVGPAGAPVSGVDAIVARDQSFSNLSVLVLPYGGADGLGRWKGCCPVVGWLGGPEVLLFASRGTDTRLLAWQVGTPQMWRVTQLHGWMPGEEFLVGSWAALRPA